MRNRLAADFIISNIEYWLSIWQCFPTWLIEKKIVPEIPSRQIIQSTIKIKDIFFLMQNFLQRLLPLYLFWGNTLKQFFSKTGIKTQVEGEMPYRKQWVIPWMFYCRVTIIQKDLSLQGTVASRPVSVESTVLGYPGRKCILCHK